MGSEASPGRLLHQVLDEIAEKEPDQLYCIHPVSMNLDDGWREISYRDLAHAVNRVAFWIDEQLGDSAKKKRHVLAYIGTNDLRYAAFVLACMKTGNTALLLSTRNSHTAFQHLLDATKCSVMVDASNKQQLRQMLDKLEDNRLQKLQRWNMPPLWGIFSNKPSDEYPYKYEHNFAAAEDMPTIILHSSGTTGNPKPINITHGYLATLENIQTMPIPKGRKLAQGHVREKGKLRFHYAPMYHFGGLVSIVECIYFKTPFVLAPDRPLDSDLFAQIMSTHHPKWTLALTPVLEDLGKQESGRKAFSQFEEVVFGGAPMSQSTGDKLSSLAHLQTVLASTETGWTPTLLCEDPADWCYLEWVPACGVRMEEVEKGLFELVIPRPESRKYHAVFHSYPDLSEYRTGDLFTPHPTKSGLWRFSGKGDDINVMKNGEKFNPVAAEKIIERHELISRAAIFGQDRYQAALLLEPQWNKLPQDWTEEWLRKQLESILDEANEALPAYARIYDTHIALTSRDKPFAQAPKGSLRRRETAKDYQGVLNSLYDSTDSDTSKAQGSSVGACPESSDREAIRSWLQQVFAQRLGLRGFGENDDLVDAGIDSLQVKELSRVLQQASKRMHPAGKPLTWSGDEVYQAGSVQALADRLSRHLSGNESIQDNKSGAKWTRADRLIHSVWNHARHLGQGGITVVLTGSTGDLGSHLLHQLLQVPTVAEIYCLNRGSDAVDRQVTNFRERGLSDGWLRDTSRVHFWQIGLGDELLGLSPAQYDYLRNTTDVYIHNAWPVNFNQPLKAFEKDMLPGLRRLLQLVEESPRRAHLHYVSSISTVGGWEKTHGPTILETLHDASVVQGIGYAESKFVAESLCGIAAQRSNLAISVHRVGQVGGPSSPTGGMWNPRDWFPAMVRSSMSMSKVPDTLGTINVNWVPIDLAAEAIVQIVQCRQERQDSSGLKVYHIVNPKARDWGSFAPLVARACGAKVVPLKEWIDDLQQQDSEGSSRERVEALPALPLFGFFKSLLDQQDTTSVPLETRNAVADSTVLGKIQPVDAELFKVWLRQWKERWLPELEV
ncbi:NRPS-like enzyme [Aspergillus saccharolyticus JOP 1030-1]|uniref:NRPS-like enzyme n=1 Tax=Aspergillus saccharolyticus JOP 1030-1 TaxID=1450539 RepID=A0A319A281_9EURO|nr:NRPS-like enzyme [Aspergillus saccharolyticus JOP 1030-1]PYH41592.1 NRPS-like enzyme [Aspergillus saccharolyticus JOP 1030-1]